MAFPLLAKVAQPLVSSRQRNFRVSLSPDLAAVLDKMVRYHFSQRYQSANEALQALITQVISPTAPTTASPSLFPSERVTKQVGVNKRHSLQVGFLGETRLQGPLQVLGLIVPICLDLTCEDSLSWPCHVNSLVLL
jgi:hypothetical protein